MDSSLYTVEAAIREASQVRLLLADPAATPSPLVAKVRLFDQALIPTINTVKADLVAAETTLTGYPTGGYSITDFGPVLLAPGGGAVFQSPIINVVYASGSPATIGGYWVEDSAGDVRQVFIYDPQRTLASIGDGFPIVCQFGYGRNS